jgi:hypothetical protein
VKKGGKMSSDRVETAVTTTSVTIVGLVIGVVVVTMIISLVAARRRARCVRNEAAVTPSAAVGIDHLAVVTDRAVTNPAYESDEVE